MKSKNLFQNLILITFTILVSFLTNTTLNTTLNAGIVRDLVMDDNQIEIINLRMGKSTVLNFIETPLRISIGNKNYYNVEFIVNDLTIQPKGEVETNLFVYGKFHRYGFILRTNNITAYDDLVKVRWKEDLQKEKTENVKIEKQIDITKEIKPEQLEQEDYKITVTNLQNDKLRNLYIIDLNIINQRSVELFLNNINFSFANKNSTNQIVEKIFSCDSLKNKDDKCNGRLFMKIIKNENFKIVTTYNGKEIFFEIKE
ncbi:MAG: hypothetical protein HQK51_05590 [Oligoflexia bacterium]|nr:hypothetical protein [Oligoflexia bacterium]